MPFMLISLRQKYSKIIGCKFSSVCDKYQNALKTEICLSYNPWLTSSTIYRWHGC